MTSRLDTRAAQQLAQAEPLARRTRIVAVPDEVTPSPSARHCPECGRVDLSDSRLAGTCEYCPGLVTLVSA